MVTKMKLLAQRIPSSQWNGQRNIQSKKLGYDIIGQPGQILTWLEHRLLTISTLSNDIGGISFERCS